MNIAYYPRIIVETMWQVFSKTKQARRGLAKVLLLILLLASFVFAWFVQKSKLSMVILDLDRTIKYKSDASTLELRVASEWSAIDDVNSLGKDFLAGWNISMGSREEPAHLFLLHLPPSATLPEVQAQLAPHQLLGYSRTSVEIRHAESVKFLTYDCFGAAATRRGVKSIAIKVMTMPDTSSLILAFTGSRQSGNTFELWLDQLAETIEYQPADRTKSIKRNQRIEIGPVSLYFPVQTWVTFDANINLIKMQSDTTDPEQFWTGQMRIIPHQEYQKFMNHYLQRIRLSRLGKFGDFSVGYTEKNKGLIVEDKRLIYSQMTYIAESKDGFGILITIRASHTAKRNAKKDIEKMLRSLQIITGV